MPDSYVKAQVGTETMPWDCVTTSPIRLVAATIEARPCWNGRSSA